MIRRLNIRTALFPVAILLLGGISMISCNKEDYVGKNPYAGAREPLDIKVNTLIALPASGTTGTVVTLQGKGFATYKDSNMVVKFNDVAGEIIEAGDSILKVKVPQEASSGMITVTVLHQVFQGPFFRVNGPIAIDSSFQSVPGAEGYISCIAFVPGGKYLLGGSFDDYGNSGLADGYHGLARINADGSLDRSFKIGKGVQGSVNAIAIQAGGDYIIGGSFNNYKERFKPNRIANIMRIHPDGSIDSTVITTQIGNQDTIPALNAYFDGSISSILQTPDSGKLVVIGAFKYFMTKDFTASTADSLRDSIRVDSIRMEGIARLNEDGSFDSSFNYNHTTHSSFAGANGPILDAAIQNDGKIIIVGQFTKYHDQPANRIARLNKDGSLDPTFNPGSGSDDGILSVDILDDGRYLIAGWFNNFNGIESNKIAILKHDGSLDNSFSVGKGQTAGPNSAIYKAAALKNNKILVAGSFDHFSGIKRDGTVILDMDGTVSTTFNNLGALEPTGLYISQILNVPNANATILVGGFTKYDLQFVNGIVKLKY